MSKPVLCSEGHTSLFCSNLQPPDRPKMQTQPGTLIPNTVKSLLTFCIDSACSEAIKQRNVRDIRPYKKRAF